MSNPIINLLSLEQLTGENYAKWKSNMNLVLINYDYKFVLLEKCPLELATNAPRAAKEAFDRWIKANNKAKCYMLVDMFELLRKQHEDMTTTYEIVQSLDGMFGQPSKKCRLEAMK